MPKTLLQDCRVEWVVPARASSPEEAARNAVEAVAHREFDLNVCPVMDAEGGTTAVDLNALSNAFYLHVKIKADIELAGHISELDYAVTAPAITDTEITGADFSQRTIKVKCSLCAPYSWDSIQRVAENLDYHVTSPSGERLDTEVIDVTED
jgi:hypothetical protein